MAADTIEVLTDERGGVRGLLVANLDWSDGTPRRIEGSEHEIPAQLVLIACGFTGPEASTFDAFGALVSDQGRALPVIEGRSHRCAPKTQGAPGPRSSPAAMRAPAPHLVVNAIADALACADEVAASSRCSLSSRPQKGDRHFSEADANRPGTAGMTS